MDQAPGPIIARLMPRPANMIANGWVPGWVKAIHTSTHAGQHSHYRGPQASKNQETRGSADDL